jgi:type II restriction/modification system DNA methylase subunit YeeA
MASSPTPREFVDKWKQVSVKERSAYQEHFRDLCRLVGHPTPTEGDPTGENYTFEAGAKKDTGGQGFADVWKRGYFAFEYKGKDGNLDRAYQQLQQYRESLFNPPLLIVSDLERIVIHSNFTNSVKRTVVLGFDELLTPLGLDQLRDVFYNPEAFKAAETVEQVTAEAAKKVASIADLLRQYGADPQQAAHFLIRIVFCLFAEDVGLLPKELFRSLLESTQRKPKVFQQALRELFAKMGSGGMLGRDLIPHFNGGLFDNDDALELDSDSMRMLFDVSLQDWGSIEPSIFGTLFERSLNPDKRAQLGAHYTSRDDILLIVEPVLMAPLRRKWEAAKQQASELAAQRDAVPPPARRSAADTRQFNKLQGEIQSAIDGIGDELATIRVLDPACGSGNFLYVSLRQLLDLEKEVIGFASTLGGTMRFPRVTPAQLFGIEKDPYAHELAQTTVWIGYIQWLRENGFGAPAEPILKKLDNIRQMDAILHIDPATGAASEPEWPAAEVIVGNPPFLGDKRMRAELGDGYVTAVRNLYGTRIPGQSDMVCYWFEKARSEIESGGSLRAGLIATQSIRGGASRRVLERIKASGGIFLAWSDKNWTLDGATVHVAIVGFDNGTDQDRHLNGAVVAEIYADLSASADTAGAVQLSENQGLSFIGTQRNGPFDISDSEAREMLASGGNPTGKTNADVIKKWINAHDITQLPRGRWIIDFDQLPIEEAALYVIPFEYVKRVVKPTRDATRDKLMREKWWLHGRSRPHLRKAISKLERCIATPMVSKHSIFVYVPTNVIAENLIVVIARDDDYMLGVLHSHQHEVWAIKQGTQLRDADSGQRYTPTSTFETFPFPWPPGKEPVDDPRVQAIAQAAKELVEKRDNWLKADGLTDAERKKRTLTNLYNARPTWLDLVHKKLDAAVAAAYGWPADLSDDEILARLLALNLERAGKQ